MCRLGSHPVQFQHPKTSRPQRLNRIRPYIITAQSEPRVRLAGGADRLLQFRCHHPGRVQEDRPAAVGADLHQRYALARRGHPASVATAQVSPVQDERSPIGQDDLAQSALAVAHHHRQPLVGDRGDPAVGVEHAELLAGHEFLRDRPSARLLKVGPRLAFTADNRDVGAALSHVRLEDHRQSMTAQEPQCFLRRRYHVGRRREGGQMRQNR